jgi:hypothetical protein
MWKRAILIATVALAFTGFTAEAASAAQLTRIGERMDLTGCTISGEWGVRAGRWNVWWCSNVHPDVSNGYELWAYVL